jgi:hypothetical protein
MDSFDDRWWEPAELLAAAHAIRTSVPPDEFFCDSSYQQVREAIAAGWFAQRRPWNKDWTIRLVPRQEEFPDVQLRSGNEVRGFEIVEADLTNRRRCDEYRRARGLPPSMEFYEPTDEAMAMREIERVIALKAGKNYSAPPNLLVYVNLDEGEPKEHETWALRERFGRKFESAWLLWQDSTFRLWPKPARIRRA